MSYQGILDTFQCEQDISKSLQYIAELHQEHCMRGVHKLSNDNTFLESDIKISRSNKKNHDTTAYNMPKIFKLFGFIPCVTTLNSVWTRKNYDEYNQIN